VLEVDDQDRKEEPRVQPQGDHAQRLGPETPPDEHERRHHRQLEQGGAQGAALAALRVAMRARAAPKEVPGEGEVVQDGQWTAHYVDGWIAARLALNRQSVRCPVSACTRKHAGDGIHKQDER